MITNERKLNASTPSWFAYISDDETAKILREISHANNNIMISIKMTSINELIEIAKNQVMAKHLIVDISSVSDPIKLLNDFSEHCHSGTQLIALGDVNNINFYRELRNLGVDDYFVKPIAKEDIVNSITHLQTSKEKIDNFPKQQIVVKASLSGIGSSSIATNLAWVLAHEFETKVCLVDWDFYFSTTALALNLEPNEGLIESLNSAQRLDNVSLDNFVLQKSDYLSVLLAQQPLHLKVNYSQNDIMQLIKKIQSEYGCSVFDMPHTARDLTSPIITEATMFLLVADSSLPSIRDSVRLIQLVKDESPDCLIKIILRRRGSDQVSEKQFEYSVGHPVTDVLSFEKRSPISAVNAGQTLAQYNPSHPQIKILRDIIHSIAPEELKSNSSLIKRLLSGGL